MMPEPKRITAAAVLERIGGIALYDLTDPAAPRVPMAIEQMGERLGHRRRVRRLQYLTLRRRQAMQIEVTKDEVAALRDVLQEKVRELDNEINRADSLRFKGELRQIERKLEHILGSVTMAMSGGPDAWEPRDGVNDLDKR